MKDLAEIPDLDHYEINLDSKNLAPDNEWFDDQEEALPVNDFIHDYYKSFHGREAIGQRIKTKQNILCFEIPNQLVRMDKSLAGMFSLFFLEI